MCIKHVPANKPISVVMFDNLMCKPLGHTSCVGEAHSHMGLKIKGYSRLTTYISFNNMNKFKI